MDVAIAIAIVELQNAFVQTRSREVEYQSTSLKYLTDRVASDIASALR